MGLEFMAQTQWRLLALSSGNAVEQTAIDEVIVEEVDANRSPATIRFWQVDNPTISIGTSQDLHADVDVALARTNNVTLVRRPSGGGSDYLSPSDICYSVIVPLEMLGHNRFNVEKNYRHVYEKIADAMKQLGIDVQFEKPCNIMTGPKKIGNMAQFTPRNVVLVHGKIRYELPIEQTLQHFTCTDCEQSHSLLEHRNIFEQAMTCVKEYGISAEVLYETLKTALTKDIIHVEGQLTDDEKQALEVKHALYKSTPWLEGTGTKVKRFGFCDEHLNSVPIIRIYTNKSAK